MQMTRFFLAAFLSDAVGVASGSASLRASVVQPTAGVVPPTGLLYAPAPSGLSLAPAPAPALSSQLREVAIKAVQNQVQGLAALATHDEQVTLAAVHAEMTRILENEAHLFASLVHDGATQEALKQAINKMAKHDLEALKRDVAKKSAQVVKETFHGVITGAIGTLAAVEEELKKRRSEANQIVANAKKAAEHAENASTEALELGKTLPVEEANAVSASTEKALEVSLHSQSEAEDAAAKDRQASTKAEKSLAIQEKANSVAQEAMDAAQDAVVMASDNAKTINDIKALTEMVYQDAGNSAANAEEQSVGR